MMRPPIDQTLSDSMSARAPGDSAFAPMPGGRAPVGPSGYGFGIQRPETGTMLEIAPQGLSNMPVLGDEDPTALKMQLIRALQPEPGQSGAPPQANPDIQQLMQMLARGKTGQQGISPENLRSRNNFGDMGGPSYSGLDAIGTDYLDAVTNGRR